MLTRSEKRKQAQISQNVSKSKQTVSKKSTQKATKQKTKKVTKKATQKAIQKSTQKSSKESTSNSTQKSAQNSTLNPNQNLNGSALQQVPENSANPFTANVGNQNRHADHNNRNWQSLEDDDDTYLSWPSMPEPPSKPKILRNENSIEMSWKTPVVDINQDSFRYNKHAFNILEYDSVRIYNLHGYWFKRMTEKFCEEFDPSHPPFSDKFSLLEDNSGMEMNPPRTLCKETFLNLLIKVCLSKPKLLKKLIYLQEN